MKAGNADSDIFALETDHPLEKITYGRLAVFCRLVTGCEPACQIGLWLQYVSSLSYAGLQASGLLFDEPV